jgi:hypothetical protein
MATAIVATVMPSGVQRLTASTAPRIAMTSSRQYYAAVLEMNGKRYQATE